MKTIFEEYPIIETKEIETFFGVIRLVKLEDHQDDYPAFGSMPAKLYDYPEQWVAEFVGGDYAGINVMPTVREEYEWCSTEGDALRKILKLAVSIKYADKLHHELIWKEAEKNLQKKIK